MDDFHKPRCKAGGERGGPTWERIGLQCCAWSVQRPPTPGVLESPADPTINIIMPRSDSNTRGVGGCLTNDSVKNTVQHPPATPLELGVEGVGPPDWAWTHYEMASFPSTHLGFLRPPTPRVFAGVGGCLTNDSVKKHRPTPSAHPIRIGC